MDLSSAFISDKWTDYEIIDAGDGEKLERWGDVIVVRPDPQIIWPRMKPRHIWDQRHMHYHRSKSGGGSWEKLERASGVKTARWTVTYGTAVSGSVESETAVSGSVNFNIRPTDFKHMGLFPEQACNWDWSMNLIRKAKRPIRVLNLFGYTGGATVCCLHAGAEVTHIDAAKGMNEWAKENVRISGIEGRDYRVLTDDVFKFVRREQRRGSFYDAVILDPPSYGRGPSGEIWKLENKLFDLVQLCASIMTDKPLFMLLNTYTTGFTATAAENVIRLALSSGNSTNRTHTVHSGLTINSGSLGLPISDSDLVLPCGISVRCVYGNCSSTL